MLLLTRLELSTLVTLKNSLRNHPWHIELVSINPENEIITVSVADGIVTLTSGSDSTSAVVTADIEADNGVAHVIDNVLHPAFLELTLTQSLGDDYSSLCAALETTKLVETLDSG
jgi:Fasciclin domain